MRRREARRDATYADALAVRVLLETTKATHTKAGMGAGVGAGEMTWTTDLGEEAEARRARLFRTQYRAVESEVVGLAVQW